MKTKHFLYDRTISIEIYISFDKTVYNTNNI